MRRCTTAFLLIVATLPVVAQEPLTLHEALDRALAAHPLLQVSSQRIRVAEGQRRQAALRPNPRLLLQTENWEPYASRTFSASRSTDNFLMVSQLLQTAGKRELRAEAAAERVRLSEIERELVEQQIAARVKAAYWRAATAAKLHELLLANGRNFDQMVEYHEIRVREGAMAEADLLRVRLEAERWRLAANTADLEAQRTRIFLQREMGLSEFPAVRLAEPMEDLRQPLLADVAQALERRAELRLAGQALAQARAALRVQQAEARPDVNVSFGLKRTGGLNTLAGIVELPLPLANRNQGEIDSALARIRLSEADVNALAALVRAEVRAADVDVQVRRRQVTETFRSLLDKALEASRIAQAAYREGGAELLRLLDAERARIEVQMLYYQTLGEYHQAVAALETAMGVIR